MTEEGALRFVGDAVFPDVEESKLNKKQIQELAKSKYKNLAGIAQQYLNGSPPRLISSTLGSTS